jgi:hypothetical protein
MSHTAPQRNPRAEAAGKKILKFGCLPAFVLLIALIALGTALDDGDDDKPEAKPSTSAPSHASDESERAAPAGDLPPKPDLTASTAYIADLDVIDPDIVHGKPDKAISRGRSQCSSFKTTIDGKKLDRAKLIEYTNYRFTSPNHPNGHGTAIAEQILDVVHKHLCPSY